MAFESIKKAASSVISATRNFMDKAERAVSYAAQPKTYAWTGKSASDMSTLEKVGYLRSLGNDNATAREAFAALTREMQTVGSRHYSPYMTNTSNQKEAMDFFGIQSFDQDWLDNNRFLLNYVNQLDMTDTVSTSGQKNWTQAQWAGYYYQMLSEAEQTTKQAENEWAQLRSSMQQNFREYQRLYGEAPSYEQLMSYIDMGDYSTLQKMDKVYSNVEDLVRLNRPVAYTPETVLGVYAALTRGKDVTGDGNYFEDAVQYTMRPTNLPPKKQTEKPDYSKWTDQQIEAKRQEIRKNGTRAELAQFEADLYASTPHLDSVDSESNFRESYYDDAFLKKYSYLGDYVKQLINRDGKMEKPAASDPWWYGAAYEYGQIEAREEATKQAEEEWTALRKWLADMAGDEDAPDAESAIELIDWDKYPMLEKIRKGQDMDLNRAVYFSDEALEGVFRAAADGEDVQNDDFDYALYAGREETPASEIKQMPEEPEPERDASPADAASDPEPTEIPDSYFQGPSAYNGEIEGYEEVDPQARRSFMDEPWEDMTNRTNAYATMIKKQFFEANGRSMTQEELIKAGLAPRSMEGFDASSIQLGVMDVGKQSIFSDELNGLAAQYENPTTGKAYENMDELIAHDPALLSGMLDYIETDDAPKKYSTTEVEHLQMLKKYQADLDRGTLDNLFASYADENAVDEDRLNASLQYIIESGLTLEEKGALGLLDRDEETQLVAERANELFVNRGNEMTRAFAIAILPDDAPEAILNVVDAAVSHLFAIETGITGGVLKTQQAGFNAARDIWSAAAIPFYRARLGEDYTLDQACEIDPILRGLTASVDKGNAIIGTASPDMSGYNYGAGFTQFLVDSAVSQKMSNFYAPVGQGFVDGMLKKLKLGGLPEMIASDNKLRSMLGKALNSAGGSVPWMLRSMSEGAQEARNMGASEADSVRYGLYKGATTGAIEGALGQAYDSLLDNSGNLISKGLSKITKGGIDGLLKTRGVTFMTNLFQQALGESLEEAAEMPLTKAGKSLFLGQELSMSGEDMKNMWDSMRMSFASSVFTSLFFGVSAESDQKIYNESERLLEKLEKGRITVDELMEYEMSLAGETATTDDINKVITMASGAEEGAEENKRLTDEELAYEFSPLSTYDEMEGSAAKETSAEVRDAARVVEEIRLAMDEAAIDTAAEAVVQQQIAEGATKDIDGEASANAAAIRTAEADIQAIQQQIDQYDSQLQMNDEQKRKALYNMISQGVSPEKGAARQLMHNIDEAAGAIMRKRELDLKKLAEKQTVLQLQIDKMQAELSERIEELTAEAARQAQEKLEDSRRKGDQFIAELLKGRADRQKTSARKDVKSIQAREDVMEHLADQIIGADTDGDPYDFFSAKNKENPEYDSQQEANHAAHYAGTDIQPDVELDSGDGDGYFPVGWEQLRYYEAILDNLPNEGYQLDKRELIKREWDGDNRETDPLAEMTNRALVTVAKTGDGEYVLVKDTERANQDGGKDAYLLMRRPDFKAMRNESSVDAEAQHILDSIDIRLNELNRKAGELEEQGIYGIDIDQTEEHIKALNDLRKQATTYIYSGRQRALIQKLNNMAANEGDQRIVVQEIKGILNSLPEMSQTGSFNLDDFVVGRYSQKRDAMREMSRMGKRVQEVSGGKSTPRISIDLLNAIPDPEQFMHEMSLGEFDITEFAAANPRLFGAIEREGEKWSPEDLSRRYESKLAKDNPNYIAIDSDHGFNLVVKKNRVRLDPSDTGRTENVNRGIATVSDAIRALEKELQEDAEKIAREQRKGYAGKHDPGRLIITMYDQQGEPVNMSYLDYVDPKTGQKRVPTVSELLNNATRITVNWVRDWKQANPNEQPRSKNGPKTIPAEKLEFTLERSDLAPNAYDPRNPDASRVLVQSDLRRAEADYERHIGMDAKTPTTKLRYFAKVCEANVNSYLQAINQAASKAETGTLTDEALRTVQKGAEKYAEALRYWQYASDRVNQMLKRYSREQMMNSGVDKMLRQYDEALKTTGNASMDARVRLAAAVKDMISEQHLNELEASIPENETLQTLQQRSVDLQKSLEEVMNARNRAAVLGHSSPAALNSEPLAEAIMEEQDIVRQQMLLLPAPSQNLRETQEQASDTVGDTVEAPASEVAENAAEKPAEELSQNAENDTEPEAETTDPVQKRQEMDRSYLSAIIGEEDAEFASWHDNEEPEAHENQAEQPELIDMETGESVNSMDDVTGSEYAEAETGEVHSVEQTYPEESAEDLSYAAPVEEFAKRAGLTRTYTEKEITDSDSHELAEWQANEAHRAVKMLTDRIDEIQKVLASGVIDVGQVEAIQAEKQRYIDERNRIKAIAKRLDAKLSASEHYSMRMVRNIADHCLETGEVDWEAPEVRARNINEIYEKDIDRMRKALQSKLVAGKTTALTVDDVAEIIGTPELDKELRMRHDVGFELSRRLHQLDEVLEDYRNRREELLKSIEEGGSTLELEAELGHIDEGIYSTMSMIENGRKSMRMYFDSGSRLSIKEILYGEGGGRLPLNVMNRIYAILKDIDANTKNTNRGLPLLSHTKNPLQAMEGYTGEWAPLFNALYIAQVQPANAVMQEHNRDIIERMRKSGLKHSESADAMRYAEGKMTEEEFESAYPDAADQRRIKRAIVEYRDIYESLFEEINGALMRNGFDPIPHRKDYIHHMRDSESGIAKACAMLGIHISDDELPTSMAGHTEETKPRRGFMSASMERHGDDTVYDIERNTMAYVNAAMRVIYHTDNITRLRQLEGIMDQTMNKRAVNSGLAQYSEVVDTKDLKRSGRNAKTAFSQMREWVTEYTNLLAGKQSFVDRPFEKLAGRNALQIANGFKNMVGDSIVVGNLNIATSNILPVMTMAGFSPVQTAAALADVVRSGAAGMRAFEAQSDFLTARYAGQKFNMNWMDTAKDKAMIPFEAIDRFAANTVVRAYQKIGLKKGWTPDVAMKWADQMAWRMMASTNIGEGANIMSSKTAGILLQFSREGINNLQFLAHDLKEISDGNGDWLKKLLGIMLGGWLYNYAFNKKTALELVTPTMESVREWDSDKTVLENLGNAAGNYAEMLNPTNLGTGSDLTDIPLISSFTEMGQAVGNIAENAFERNGEGVRDGLADFFWATMGFVPGGLSIERLAKGASDYYRGYTTDSKGNIKFTIDNDLFSAGSIHDAIFTLLLSPTGTKGGREYMKGGYQTMTKTQTAAFHSKKATGMTNQEAFDSVNAYAEETGNRDASKLVLPDWAAESSETDWMKAAQNAGPDAYPKQTPNEMRINGVDHELTDEEKERFVTKYRLAYKTYIKEAITAGEDLAKAADKAYSKARANFKKEMEG